ncbi:4Fe-4S binding protein [Clostridium sp. KNHs205]|jgi:ech hydrogenase subunit F|uniref:4Fe-4S binding protein n=1 Tax=Clostridium sp. KNHs205 TaxID=1449050 RepID=UPI00051C8B83|nr:4Fe-4S binding protein [Clostridium sp. KNHs205]MDF2869636.1 4Fe-4S ferredoxin iron-sulfur binding domain protein [Anaerocolumna sp.]
MAILNMTKTLIKSLFHGPYTCLYPLKEKDKYERTRGKIEIDMPQCIYCGMCQRRCPTGAILVSKADASWEIDRLKCIQCGYCSEVCPKKCLTMDNHYTPPSYGESKDQYTNA